MPNKFPWKYYEHPVYWTLPDDGAPIRCSGDCGQNFKCKDVYLTQTPDGIRRVLCKECIDEYWIKSAKYLGEYDK